MQENFINERESNRGCFAPRVLTHGSIFFFAIVLIEVTIAQDYFTFYQVSRSQKYEISTPQEVKHVSTQTTGDFYRSVHSQLPVPLNNNTSTSGWYTADVAPSTLLFLAGPKDCLEDSIPELGRSNFSSVLLGNLCKRLMMNFMMTFREKEKTSCHDLIRK